MMFRNGPCVIFLSKRGVSGWDGGTEKAPWFLGLGHGKGFTTGDYLGRLRVFFFSYLMFLFHIFSLAVDIGLCVGWIVRYPF
jgi:hypothetical protein